jgi:hypothetical protein
MLVYDSVCYMMLACVAGPQFYGGTGEDWGPATQANMLVYDSDV